MNVNENESMRECDGGFGGGGLASDRKVGVARSHSVSYITLSRYSIGIHNIFNV